MTTDGLFDDDDVWRPILERGFGAVDMEAAGVAEVCEDAGVDWSVYRGISDRPDEHIVDQAVFALSKPDGSADPVALAKYLARDPRRAKALAHLNRCMQAAARWPRTRPSPDLVGGLTVASVVAGGRSFGSSRRAMTCRSMSFSDAMRRIVWITEPRVIDCQRVSRDVPTTIWVICWSTAAAKIVLATSSPSSVCQRAADRLDQLLELGRAGLRRVGIARRRRGRR